MRLSSEQRQEQIIAAAIYIIHEKGFPSLSIRELASRVGISEPAIYRHFKNKDEIIMGILNKMEQFGQHIKEQLKHVNGELEKIEKMFSLQLSYFQKNQPMTTIMLSEEVFHLNRRLKHKLEIVTRTRYQMLTELLVAAQQKNLIIKADVDILASIIMGTIRMWIFKWKLNDYKFSLTDKGNAAISTIISLIKKT